MRIAICGRNLDDLRKILENFPVSVVDEHPDAVISYGGDGALLGSESKFPGIPKMPMRDSRSHLKCDHHAEEQLIEMLLEGTLSRTRLTKLSAQKKGTARILSALNDVFISKEIISSAVRYRLSLDRAIYKDEIAGDGLVIATPFGSTGYYRSITHSSFQVGIGLAFNNSTEPLDHIVISEATRIEVEILRGPGTLLVDNSPERVSLREGDFVSVWKAEEEAEVLGLDTFRCKQCQNLRQRYALPRAGADASR